MEIWKTIQDYEGCYEISSAGRVKSLERKCLLHTSCRKISEKMLVCRINNFGYLEVRLSKLGKTKTKFIHILKAQAFIPNPENKKEVNHKDGNKLNNNLDNLEWVTHAENVEHAYNAGLIKLKAKQVIDTCSGEEFSSAKEASQVYDINYHTLRNYLNGGISQNPTCLKYKVAA